MRFLLDQNRSQRLASILREHGHDALHVLGLGLERAEDLDLLRLAELQERTFITGDFDLWTTLAGSRRTQPSIISFTSKAATSAQQQADVILKHLDDLDPELSEGAAIIITDTRIQVRRLPLIHET